MASTENPSTPEVPRSAPDVNKTSVAKKIWTYLTGNRLCLAANFFHAGAVTTLLSGAIDRPKDTQALAIGFAAFASVIVNIYPLETVRAYTSAKKHILLRGGIDPQYFEQSIRLHQNEIIKGYCTLQGIYLAAKELGATEQFFALKQRYSGNIVPNF